MQGATQPNVAERANMVLRNRVDDLLPVRILSLFFFLFFSRQKKGPEGSPGLERLDGLEEPTSSPEWP